MLFFTAIALLGLGYVKLSFSWLALVVLVIIWVRILATQNKKIVISIGILSFILFGYLTLWQNNITKKSINEATEMKSQHLLLYPDNCEVSGNLLKLQGKWFEGRQEVTAYYTLESQAQQQYWQANQKTKILTFDGELQAINGPTNENQFDYQRFILTKNIVNSFQISQLQLTDNLNVLKWHQKFLARIHDLRKFWLLKLDHCKQPLGWFGQVLLLGYQSDDFQTISDNISQLGLLYLFSLSGMHVFYLVAGIKKLFSWLHLTKETTNKVLLLILPLYAILGGGALSLTRSLAMSWLKLFSDCLNLRQLRLNTTEAWSIVLIMNLFLTPAAIFALGAQLSYLLTFILVVNRPKNAVLTGIKMSAYSIPLMLWHTFEWNIWTTLLSILINPLFEWLILPSVLLGIFCWPIQFICNYFLKGLVAVLAFLAKLKGMLIFGKPSLFFVLVFLGITFLCENKKHLKTKLTLLILAYVNSFIIIHCPLESEVVYFDIGQGDSTLIRDALNRQVVLIDTGGQLNFNTEKWQERVTQTKGQTIIANYLLSKGLDHIDVLYLTHQDTDHVGNFASLSQSIKINKIAVPAGMEKLASFQVRLKQSINKMSDVSPCFVGYQDHLANDYQLLHPFTTGEGKNEDSLVLYRNINGVHFIFTGDLDQANERKILTTYPQLKVDVLKTGHHGSKTATAPEFVAGIGPPKLAIISAGKNNRYGHPNEETLETLSTYHVPYLLTADVGMIKLIPKDATLSIKTYARGAFYDQSTTTNR